jgi:hypothetical protein
MKDKEIEVEYRVMASEVDRVITRECKVGHLHFDDTVTPCENWESIQCWIVLCIKLPSQDPSTSYCMLALSSSYIYSISQKSWHNLSL